MRCRTCDYRLWNLRSRTCPECNTPFNPSDFEFEPNAVQYLCPSCGQAYYGAGEKGHLTPPEFHCVRCGRHVRMDDMVLLPAEGLDEEQATAQPAPWLLRTQIGFFRGWWQTVTGALFRPGRLIRRVPTASSLLTAWWFALFTQVPVVLLGMGLLFGVSFAIGFAAGAGAPPLLGVGLGIGATVILSWFFLVVVVALWGAMAHVILCIFERPEGGMRRTYQAICYSSGANVISGIPCIGPYVGWIWWVASAVVMLKNAHRTSGGRAAAAVIIPPVLAIISVVGLYIAFLFWMIPQLQSAAVTPGWPGIPPLAVHASASEILDYASQHDGEFPDHPLRLGFDETVLEDGFLMHASNTRADHVPVGDATLSAFCNASRARREELIEAAAAVIPKSATAVRVGDVVFTYYGLEDVVHSRLWFSVGWPDPDQNPNPGMGTVYVACPDLMHVIPLGDFDRALADQNRLRARHNIPPLPHPRDVRHIWPPDNPYRPQAQNENDS